MTTELEITSEPVIMVHLCSPWMDSIGVRLFPKAYAQLIVLLFGKMKLLSDTGCWGSESSSVFQHVPWDSFVLRSLLHSAW